MNDQRLLVSKKIGNIFEDFSEQVLRWYHLRSRRKYTFKLMMDKSEIWGNPRGSFYKCYGSFQHDSGRFIKKDSPCWIYLPRSTFKKELERYPQLQNLTEKDELILSFSKINNKRVCVHVCNRLTW